VVACQEDELGGIGLVAGGGGREGRPSQGLTGIGRNFACNADRYEGEPRREEDGEGGMGYGEGDEDW
jgi:hypothetical protein